MSDKQHLESLATEADLYRSQGLLDAARDKYQELLQFIQNHEQYSKNEKLVDAVRRKIQAVRDSIIEIAETPQKPELSEETQNLIQKLFSFAKNEETAAMEGAVALAKFGQYEKALTEFKMLLNKGVLPLAAAKNILRCHLAISTPDVAIVQFKSWVFRNDFSKGDLKALRSFLQNLLEKRDIKADLPEVIVPAEEETKRNKKEEDVLDISSVGVAFKNGPLKGEMVEFEVGFQSGNTISVIIPADQKHLLSAFEPGLRLQDMQCYSLIAVFNGTGVVSGRSEITSGPKKGHFTLDITISGA